MRKRLMLGGIVLVCAAAAGCSIVLVCITAAGCNRGISREGAAVLRSGTRVEVFRVDPDWEAVGSGPKIGEFRILATGQEQGSDFAARLATIVLGPEVRNLHRFCGIQPGVAFRVWRDDQCVEVLVCFRCDVLCAHLGTGAWQWHGEDLRDFTAARPQLLALCKEALPDDREIATLPDTLN